MTCKYRLIPYLIFFFAAARADFTQLDASVMAASQLLLVEEHEAETYVALYPTEAVRVTVQATPFETFVTVLILCMPDSPVLKQFFPVNRRPWFDSPVFAAYKNAVVKTRLKKTSTFFIIEGFVFK